MKCEVFTSPQAFTYDEMCIIYDKNTLTTLKL